MPATQNSSRPSAALVQVVNETDGIVVVCLEGEFDAANGPALDDQIDRVLEGGNHLILDLSEATFIDSSMIHLLVRAAKAATQRKQVAVLQLGTAAIVERVLEIARIEQVLPRAHDRHEAVHITQQQAQTL